MKEKIKTICLILITIVILITAWHYWVLVEKQIQKETNYLNAYKDCMEIIPLSWKCIGVLSGESSE